MPLPVRHLTMVQNWDCQGCSNCCREFQVHVTAEERSRIQEQGWSGQPEFAGVPLFLKSGSWWSGQYQLNHRPDGRCVFLSDENRCRIHERFGPDAKPFACRLYPFILIPTQDHFRVGLRYSCPSAAANQGRPLTEHARTVTGYAAELEERAEGRLLNAGGPQLQPGQAIDWRDLGRFVQALEALLKNQEDRVERRMRKCLTLANLCRQAKFDAVKGGRLVEFLNLVGASLDGDVPQDPHSLPPPSWVGRLLCRQAAALYVRKDQGPDRTLVPRRRLSLLRAAWRFARGTGPIPRLHGRLPETSFERVEETSSQVSAETDHILERYYLVKVGSMQFFGATNFGMSLWDGFESLALTLPIILWLMRIFKDLPRPEAAILATHIVDNNFGFNPLLGSARMKWTFRILARRGDLQRLIGWYAR